MTAKSYLNQIRIIDQDIQSRIEEKQRLYATLIGSPSITHDVVQSSKTDAYDERYMKIIEAGEDIDKRIDKLVDKKIEASRKIDGLDLLDNTSAVILRERYINLKTWEEIANAMNYSVRHINNLHSKALKDFDKIT
ncbi:DUF1492 domain-containing protein [Jeotgalibaca porci]|uniref:DUF1492 domain-containing protein n=1 Tax=Jeotgalibaca porci TaxID=1868793 RepID=UPI00359FB3F0